jgi:hypothetical protein
MALDPTDLVFASCATDCVVVAGGVVSDRVPVLLSCRCGSRRNACCRLDPHLPASALAVARAGRAVAGVHARVAAGMDDLRNNDQARGSFSY